MKMLESRINSVELCELINQLRKEEKGESAKVLLHKSLMEKIRKELETMKKLGLGAEKNILPGSFKDKQNQERPCFSLNASGMRQILNSESVYVRCKTEEYITKLEEKNRQLREISERDRLLLGLFSDDKMIVAESHKALVKMEVEEATKPLLKEIEDKGEQIEIITTHTTTLVESKDIINKLIRKVANVTGKHFSKIWNEFYSQINYKLNINIKNRKKDRKSDSYLSTLNEEEMFEAEKIARNWAVKIGIDVKDALSL